MSRRGASTSLGASSQGLTEGGRIGPPLVPTGGGNTGPVLPGAAMPNFNPSGRGVPPGITDPLVGARYAEAVDLNPAAFVTTPTNGWHMIRCDRPMIVWPFSTTIEGGTGKPGIGTYSTGAARVISFAPNRIPSNVEDAQRSKGAGVCYLPNPGRWYLRANLDGDETKVTINYLLIDAQDPAVAARYLSEPGCHRIRTNSTVNVTNASTILVGQNRNRTGLLLTATAGPLGAPAIQQIRLAFGDTADAANGNWVGTSTNGILSMFGDACWKGSVSGIYSGANAAAYPAGGVFMSVLEWE